MKILNSSFDFIKFSDINDEIRSKCIFYGPCLFATSTPNDQYSLTVSSHEPSPPSNTSCIPLYNALGPLHSHQLHPSSTYYYSQLHISTLQLFILLFTQGVLLRDSFEIFLHFFFSPCCRIKRKHFLLSRESSFMKLRKSSI